MQGLFNLPGEILSSLAAGDVGAAGEEAELATVGGVTGAGVVPPPGKHGRQAA